MSSLFVNIFGFIDDTIYREEWDVAMSLCGGLNSENPPNYERFNEHLITYEQFINDPAIFKNPNLIFRINGQMYEWETACPLILSLALYRKSLPKVIASFFFFHSYFQVNFSFKTCLVECGQRRYQFITRNLVHQRWEILGWLIRIKMVRKDSQKLIFLLWKLHAKLCT